MALAQSLTAIIIFWAIIGGLGASLLLPAMQSLIHGNFEGAAQKQGLRAGRAPRRRSPPPSARCSAASSRPTCRGGSRSLLEVVDHRGRPARASGWSATCRTPGRASSTSVGAVLSVVGMGGIVLGILVWQEGGEAVGALLAVGAVAHRRRSPAGCVRRKREGKPALIDPDLFRSKLVPARDLGADAAADRPRRRR